MSAKKIAAIPTHVKASRDKDGRERPAHIAVRHKKVTFKEDVGGECDGTDPLDCFIGKHGGPEHLRESLEEMTADQRAKLIDAMAHVGGCTAADVMKKLGIHELEASEDEKALEEAKAQFSNRLASAKDAGVITSDEYDTISEVCERAGLAAAVEAVETLRASADVQGEAALPMATITAASEGAAGARASLQIQADEIYQKHAEAMNQAVRADFEVEKRQIRGWKIPAQMTEAADQSRQLAESCLAEWRAFCEQHGLKCGLY